MSRERWQELDEKASAGPWLVDPKRGCFVRELRYRDCTNPNCDSCPEEYYEEAIYEDQHVRTVDTEFIAAARTAWPAAERECEHLRAERDQVLALLRAVRGELGSWINSTEASDALRLIDTSGLLDDEGQQQPR